MLVNGSGSVMSAGTTVEICMPKVLLWCTFQIVKIAYNLSTFNLHQTKWYTDGIVVVALFCIYVQRVLWLEFLDSV